MAVETVAIGDARLILGDCREILPGIERHWFDIACRRIEEAQAKVTAAAAA
ncbi:MAG TPA: hypothetical protein VMS01_04315 [Stellaceae bacterium]|nr:hypothetical protein [Stellaceae bacterium]